MPTINQKWLCKSEQAKIFLKSRDIMQREGGEMAMEFALFCIWHEVEKVISKHNLP